MSKQGHAAERKAAVFTLRVAVSGALLAYLVWQAPSFKASELWPDFNNATPFWLIGGLLLTFASIVLGTVRWHQVTTVLGLQTTPRRLFSHYTAGLFLSNFVPTTIGGDVLRAGRLTADTEDGSHSIASVLLERLSGWLVLPAFTFIGLLLNSGLRELHTPVRIAALTSGLTLLALVAILVLIGNPLVGRWISHHEGWIRYANGLHIGIDELRTNPRSMGRVIAFAFAYQATGLAAAGCAAKVVGINGLGITALMAFIPAVLIIQVLPLALGGLGLREGALVLFLSELDVSDERAIAMGLLLYFLTLVCSLSGLPPLVHGRRLPKP